MNLQQKICLHFQFFLNKSFQQINKTHSKLYDIKGTYIHNVNDVHDDHILLISTGKFVTFKYFEQSITTSFDLNDLKVFIHEIKSLAIELFQIKVSTHSSSYIIEKMLWF